MEGGGDGSGDGGREEVEEEEKVEQRQTFLCLKVLVGHTKKKVNVNKEDGGSGGGSNIMYYGKGYGGVGLGTKN